MKKRLVSILLVLVMVLGMLPTVAFAADTAPAEISSASEFAAMKAGGNYILTKDIEISTPYSGFSGTFDGNYHTITLKINAGSYTGLFTALIGTASGTTVKNLIVEGSVTSSGSYVGGIAGNVTTYNGSVRIENCKNNATISGTSYVGGIIGRHDMDGTVTIESCANTGSVTGSDNVGGIAGRAVSVNMTNCYNQGAISSTATSASNGGGLVGSGKTLNITNCYTTGKVTGQWSAAVIPSPESNVVLKKVYALDGTNSKYWVSTGATRDDVSNFEDEETMKSASFATTLGSGFMAKSGDYPILSWETPKATKVFKISPETATLTVYDLEENAPVYTGTGAEHTVALAAGSYYYTVTCAGYEDYESDDFEVLAADAEVGKVLAEENVTLKEDASAWTTISVTKDPASAAVTIKDASGAAVSAQDDGSYKLLKTGKYTYTATTTDEGYEAVSGDVDLTASTLDVVLPQVTGLTIKTPATKTEYYQGDAIDTTGLEVTISYKSGATVDVAAADFASKGITVSFSSAVVSDDVTVTISYKGQSTTYTVSVKEKEMSSVFNGLKGYATVEYSSDKTSIAADKAFVETTLNGETVLKSNSKGVSSSKVTITIKFASELPTTNFVFDYKTSSEASSDYLSINGSTNKSLSGDKDWATYSLKDVKPGDTLTLTYVKDYSVDKFDDCVYLKNFGFAFNATFNVKTAGATVTLKNKDTGATINGTDGKFVVTAGTYEYTVSKFGFVPETGEFTITNTDFSKDVTLKEGSKQKVTLNIAVPEDAIGDYTLTIKSGSDYSDTKTSSEKKVELELTPATYTYTITHPYCETETGTFTVGESASSVDIALVRALVFQDFFTDCVGIKAENHDRRPWKIVKDQTNGNYLTTEGVSTGYGTSYLTTITLTATDNVRLSFDVTPYCYGSSYRFVIAKNGTSIKNYDRSDKWETFTTDLNKGDVLTLTFTPYGTSYYTRLKNFQSVKLATIDFTMNPADAAITVKNAAGTVVNPTSGTTYVLSEGEYTYTASKFGYEDVEGEFTVEGGKDKTITVPALSELPKFGVAFGITLPEDCQDDGYTVTIKQGTTVAYTGSDVSCKLPAGDYTYTVSSPKCETATGSFTVKGNMALRVTLERKLVFADFFPAGVDAVNDAANPYKIVTSDDGNYLTTQGYTGAKTYTITLTFTKGGLFSFDYYGATNANQNYPFTVKKGSETLLTSYNSAAWKEFRTVVEAGDVLTLYSNRASTVDTFVHLKNFKLSGANTVSFTVETEDAVLTVKDANGKTIAPSEGTTYELSDGTYTYTVSKFGFAAAEETFTVAGADLTITVPALKALDTKKITFQLTPASAAVSVSHAAAGAQTANDNGEYELLEGETYTYTVTCEGYGEKSGTITVTDDETIEVTLDYLGDAWDGTSTTKPSGSGTVSDPYQISNGAELAWFSNEVTKNSKTTICAELTADINLGGKDWSDFKISEYKYNDLTFGYAGTFDGKYHTISGLSGTSGLFDCIGKTGVVKNLIVEANIAASGVVGIVANSASGTIENCWSKGYVSSDYSSGAVGGILGRGLAGNVITNCANTAEVKCTYTRYAAGTGVGGIAGYTPGAITNCYNTGKVSSTAQSQTSYGIGGLVGQLRSGGSIKNSYSAGTVTGPSRFGALVGENSNGTISGSFYLSTAASNGVGTGSSTGLTAKTEAEMKDKSFIREDLGMKLYHVDTDAINGGYPVLAWQGGSEVVITDDEKHVTLDLQALTLRDLDLAETIETLRAQADEEVEDMVADLTLSELNEYIQDNFEMADANFKTREEALEIFREKYYQIVAESYFEENGVEIDLTSDGTIEPDNAGIYHIKNAAHLELVTTGENGSKISWTVAPAGYLDLSTGKVTLPASGTVTLTLTATAKAGSEQKTRDLSVVLYSAPKQADELFTEIQNKLSEKSAFIQPVQIRGHKTVQDAMSYWLYVNGYDDEGIEVSFVSAGTRYTNFNGDTTAFIGDNGVVTYYQGQAGTSSVNQVVYNNVQLKLTKDGAEKTIKATVHIGWDTDKAEELMNQALEQLSWENIRGQNTNEVSDETVADFSGTIVGGQVSEKLSVQRSFTFSGATVRIGYISLPSDAVTADWEDSRISISPRRPDKGEDPTTFDLQLVTLFDDNLDDYTKEALKSRDTDTNTTLRNQRSFRITVAPQTESAETVLDQKLKDIYPSLMKDFYDKKTVIDMKNVTADIQLPTATQMSNAGIFDYVFEDHILRFTSSNPDVLEVYGYRLMAYRPLPDEDPVDVTFTVEICKRGEKDADGKYTYGATLGKASFTLTIQPLTQKELNDAAALMKKLCTEEVYWNGIKGENTDKNNITKDLNSFDEMQVNSDGSITYIRGAINKNFNRVEISELPGYDPMAVYGETWRLFRSSRPDVLKHENLVIRQQPEYNTKVTIDSVMGYEKYARYYIKHVLGNRDDAEQYKDFAKFYKQPISIEVTVTGTTGLDDPNPPETFSAYVYVDAYKPDGKTSIDGFEAKYTLDEPYEYEVPYTGSPVTALEVLRAFFMDAESGYTSNITSSSYGAYISYITDPNGVTLTAATEDRPYSGWMYTVSGKFAENMIDSEFLKDGDLIHFYFVENYYTDLDPDSDEYKQYKAMADDAIALIDAIPSEITSENAAEYESAVSRARRAYDDLYAGIRDSMISEESKQKLEDAEAKLAAYKDGSQIADVEALIDALPAAKRMALSDKDALEKAEAAYAALTEDQQAKVNETLVQKLADCRAKLDELLVDGGDDLAAAEAVEQLIRQTPADSANVTENYAQAIEKASEAYKALSTKARKLVASELSKRLTANEKALTANQKAADKVDTLIEKLPEDAQTLTLSQSKSVTSAKTAYDKLTDAQKTFVQKDNVTRLNASVAKIAELQAEADKIADDKAAAAAVDKLVKALPKTGKVKTSDKAKIEAAEAAYAALTDDQKAYLTTDAEALLASARAELDAAIEEENAQIDASEYATILIRALPAAEDVTLADQEAIEAAREAYELGKDHVEKADLKLLTACEKALKKAIKQDEKDQKSAATFIAKIEKLPQPIDVVVKNKRAIEAVRKAYTKLNDNAKAYADANTEAMQKLADCEAALEAAILDEEKADEVEALIKKLPTVKRVKDTDEEAVQTAWDAYSELTAKQKDLITAKNFEKLLALCEHFGIDTTGEETDVEALALAQEEAELQAAAIEAFVLADDEDTADDAE